MYDKYDGFLDLLRRAEEFARYLREGLVATFGEAEIVFKGMEPAGFALAVEVGVSPHKFFVSWYLSYDDRCWAFEGETLTYVLRWHHEKQGVKVKP